MSILYSSARRLGLGTLARQLYHRPLGTLRQSLLEGGPIEQHRTSRGLEAMILAADQLPPLKQSNYDGASMPIYFMTGRNYWYQTVFCFYSLVLSTSENFVPILIDDGTIDDDIEARLRRIIPWLKIQKQDETLEVLSRILPPSRYPHIHAWRLRQPLTRKITDLHAGQSGWKLLLDSDMLFFRRPDWLVNWCSAPSRPAYMVDCGEAYGYSAALRAEIGGSANFPSKANIGFFGWLSDEVDFDWVEYALKTMMEREGPRYNITQGLTSMMFADRDCDVAPAEDYIVLPDIAEGRRPRAVLHHYVAHSKRSYFQHGWRRIASAADALK
jgi:hypothetical protein